MMQEAKLFSDIRFLRKERSFLIAFIFLLSSQTWQVTGEPKQRRINCIILLTIGNNIIEILKNFIFFMANNKLIFKLFVRHLSEDTLESRKMLFKLSSNAKQRNCLVTKEGVITFYQCKLFML